MENALIAILSADRGDDVGVTVKQEPFQGAQVGVKREFPDGDGAATAAQRARREHGMTKDKLIRLLRIVQQLQENTALWTDMPRPSALQGF